MRLLAIQPEVERFAVPSALLKALQQKIRCLNRDSRAKDTFADKSLKGKYE
jgi:hypothetical protein